MIDLPPYSGDMPTCRKCGNVGAYTKHRAFGDSGREQQEHLERSCRRCDYEWAEATIEQMPPVPAQQPGEAS